MNFIPLPESIHFGTTMSYEGLSVLPVISATQSNQIDYLTLDEAIKDELVQITEVNQGGNVPELLFENRASKPVLLVDGEELVGAKQNRTLNLTILAPANNKIVIPVSCVEAGRWNYTSDNFTNSDRTHFARGRAKKMASVSQSMKREGSRRSNQGEVWADIDMKFSRMQMRSETSAMSDMFASSERSINKYLDKFTAEDNQIGAFFFLHGSLVGFDIFDKDKTFARLFPKLIRSYAIEAVEIAEHSNDTEAIKQVESLISSLKNDKWDEYPATGLGQDYRFNSPRIAAASLVEDDIVIHASGFILEETDTSDEEVSSRMASLLTRRRNRFH